MNDLSLTGSTIGLRSAFVKAGLAYCLLIVYVSTVIGPVGIHFVPIDIHTAWHRFLAIGYDRDVVRADWNSNLLMFLPLGVMSAGALWPQMSAWRRCLAAATAFSFCVAFVLAVKFVQLYFPPRTVSLDYIIAQSLGALIGVGVFIVGRRPVALARNTLSGGGRAALTVALAAYSLALLAFYLFPFDVVLSVNGLRRRLQELPDLLLALPGGETTGPWAYLAPFAEAIETVPLGFLIGLNSRRFHVLVAAVAGLLGMSAICLLQTLIGSSSPHLFSILLRTAGLIAGASVVDHIDRLKLIRWRLSLAKAVPVLAMTYLVVVAAAKGLIALDWRTPTEAWTTLDWRGLVPFWDSYIVSKSHAAAATIAHILLYAPIGVMVWLRRGTPAGGRGYAAALAITLSLLVEVGRWLRPQFQPDFSNAVIAGIAAACAVPVSDWIWRALNGAFPTPGLPAPAPVPAEPRAGVVPPSPRRTRPSLFAAAGRLLTATGCAVLTAAILARYPLSPWPLALILIAYAAALFRWPVLWLLIVPATLPAIDMAPWTGWLFVGESDLFILVTIAVLLLRCPPARTDLALGKFAFAAILLSCLVYALSAAVGLWLVPAAPTANPYLSAWDGLRISKGFVEALALFPFLARDIRRRTNALVWLGAGMIGGLTLVAAAAIAERAAFVGLLDFVTDYRIVATFSAMHLGGGLIGAYVAMAIPFLLLCLAAPRLLVVPGGLVAIASVYVLIVTFARTAYAAAVIATMTSCLGWAVAAYRVALRRSTALAPAAIAAVFALAVVGFTFGAGFMHYRIERAAVDLAGRETNWADGWEVHKPGLATAVFGMGLGTYPRIFRAHAVAQPVPSNFLVSHDAAGQWLVIAAGAPGFYFGQKVAATRAGDYTIEFAFRSPYPDGAVTVIMCEKLLLYSDHCGSASFAASAAGKWTEERGILHMGQLASPRLGGLLRRPLELSFHIGRQGGVAEIGSVRLYNPEGQQIIYNGDFAQGLARWYFTDDDHTVWRMKDQFLMLLFEQGGLGIASYVLMITAALLGLWQEIRSGNKAAAPIAGAIVAYFCAGLFDYLLEAPRLSTLFYLLCFAGLLCANPSRSGVRGGSGGAKLLNRCC